jgi:hypothetical protein
MRATVSGRYATNGIAEVPESRVDPADLVLDVYQHWCRSARPGDQRPAAYVLAVITRLCCDRLNAMT